MREKLKNIPFVGFLLRWFNNLLRLNNLKHTLFMQQHLIVDLSTKLDATNSELAKTNAALSELQAQNTLHHQNYQHIKDTIKYQLDRSISSASMTLYQKILKELNTTHQEPHTLEQNIKNSMLDDYYLSFEETFRGSQELIRERYKEYLTYLTPDIKTALDIGCGRGEWIELLQQNSIDAYGIDLNRSMLDAGKKRGVKNLKQADAFEFFKSCKDNSYDLVTAFHIIEHIPFEKLFLFLGEISRVAKPDALIILETPNPANLQVGAYTFYRDPTHLNPLPSEVVSFMLDYMGFRSVEVHFLHPYSSHLEENSQSAKLLNELIYTDQDYLIRALNKDKKRVKQILVDVSAIFQNDLKTGIQRVIRSQLQALIKLSPLDYAIEPVYLRETGASTYAYAYAELYCSNLLDIELNISDELVQVQSGDIFYGVDFAPHEVSLSTHSSLYKEFASKGVKLYFMVYDLLPILKPHFFPLHMKPTHTEWLNNITQEADTLISISKSVENELSLYIQEQNLRKPNLVSLHLGADIIKLKPNPHQKTIKPTFLMAGTIEPRKGHAQTLEAFELLWKQNIDVALIIVGKKGWNMDNFLEILKTHPELNNHLAYLDAASDEELSTLYQTSTALIAPSETEGFGLPLIEAAQYELPLILRDIEVFKEVASAHAYYFKDTKDAKSLAEEITHWLKLYKKGAYPKSTHLPHLTWEQNAQKLLEIFRCQN